MIKKIKSNKKNYFLKKNCWKANGDNNGYQLQSPNIDWVTDHSFWGVSYIIFYIIIIGGICVIICAGGYFGTVVL